MKHIHNKVRIKLSFHDLLSCSDNGLCLLLIEKAEITEVTPEEFRAKFARSEETKPAEQEPEEQESQEQETSEQESE